jgi:hypothetical protein
MNVSVGMDELLMTMERAIEEKREPGSVSVEDFWKIRQWTRW